MVLATLKKHQIAAERQGRRLLAKHDLEQGISKRLRDAFRGFCAKAGLRKFDVRRSKGRTAIRKSKVLASRST
jgi:hypothetical protein